MPECTASDVKALRDATGAGMMDAKRALTDADGDAEAPRCTRVLLLHHPAHLGSVARARVHLSAVHLHHDLPVGLLLVAHADHVDLDREVEHVAREAERGSPLTCPGLGGKPLGALLHVVVRLRDRRVRLMTACWACSLVLVVDTCRGLERLLKAGRPYQRCGPP